MKYLFLITIIALLLSCNSSKNVQKNQTKTDSTWYWKAQELSIDIAKLKEENERLQMEFNNNSVVFESQPCPNLDSLLSLDSAGRENARHTIGALQNQLEVAADGSIRARGAIKSYQSSNEKLLKELNVRDAMIEDYKNKLAEDSGHVKTEIITKTVEKKVQFIPWWMFVIAGLGYVIWALGLIPKLKSKIHL